VKNNMGIAMEGGNYALDWSTKVQRFLLNPSSGR